MIPNVQAIVIISFLIVLGKGEFGQVYKGQAVGIIPDAPERNVVAVKMVKGELGELKAYSYQYA